MARTQAPHSATAQFFINVADNDFLNFSGESMQGWGYCVFAEVVEGMDVVDKIKGVSTAAAVCIRTCRKKTLSSKT
ncbi:peptidyl-prolyl cis-trans isomerase B (rotamase B) [Citrobacter koseri]|uniref:peptidylprolyl isomerase n=1 Tax=Citrobacter koseri TaxID=545 RepID=A0A447UT26_CITKO|nr:peptidyl-prolyl cis-trans isomerase B (rotamase B) [Citrobacter koseri]